MYEESSGYIFELSTTDGTLRDMFEFYGPFSAGYDLAEKRGALCDAPYIGHQQVIDGIEYRKNN